jgi:hypothetical protein
MDGALSIEGRSPRSLVAARRDADAGNPALRGVPTELRKAGPLVARPPDEESVMRLASIAIAFTVVSGLVACRPAGGPEVASAALLAAEAPAPSGPEATSACAESLAAFTAADVRARRDAHAVVARVEPGVVARVERGGLLCEATLAVTWHESDDAEETNPERSERVRVVAHRQHGGELAVLVHESAEAEPAETVAMPASAD